MQRGAVAHDAVLLKLVADRQRRSIVAAGFDPARFAARTDLAEYNPLNRVLLRIGAAFASATGRRELADNLKAIASYMKHTAEEAKELPGLIDKFAQGRPGPATPYQRRDDHVFLSTTADLIGAGVQASATLNRDRFEAVLNASILATAPIGRCNAEIYRNAAGDRFAVLLDDEIGRVCAQMGFLFAGLVVERQGQASLEIAHLSDRLAPGAPAARLYVSAVQAFVSSGSTRGAVPRAMPSKFEVDLISMVGQLGFLWTLAHELAHGMCGHLEGKTSLALHDDDEEGAADLAFSLEAETAADAIASEVVRGVCAHWGCAPWFAKIAAAANLLVYDRVYALIGETHAPHLSADVRDSIIQRVTRHPTPGERLARLVEGDGPDDIWLRAVISRLNALPIPSRRAHRRWNALIAGFEAAA